MSEVKLVLRTLERNTIITLPVITTAIVTITIIIITNFYVGGVCPELGGLGGSFWVLRLSNAAPRHPKTLPDAQTPAQDAQETAQETPKGPRDCSKTPENGSRTLQDCPETA